MKFKVLRPSSQEEKNGAGTVGQNQHIDGKEEIFVAKNDTHKIRGLYRVITDKCNGVTVPRHN